MTDLTGIHCKALPHRKLILNSSLLESTLWKRKWIVKVKSLSRSRLLATPWTGAYEAPPSMGFSRQEYWSGVPLPSPRIKIG